MSPESPAVTWYRMNAGGHDFVTENLKALFADTYRQTTCWDLARQAYSEVVRLTDVDTHDKVVGLLVYLTDSDEIAMEPPAMESIQAEVHETTPPALFIRPVCSSWDAREFEEYRTILSNHALGSADAPVRCTYAVYRTLEEKQREWSFGRQLMFERPPESQPSD